MAHILKRPMFARGVMFPRGAVCPEGITPPKDARVVEEAPAKAVAKTPKTKKDD